MVMAGIEIVHGPAGHGTGNLNPVENEEEGPLLFDRSPPQF